MLYTINHEDKNLTVHRKLQFATEPQFASQTVTAMIVRVYLYILCAPAALGL